MAKRRKKLKNEFKFFFIFFLLLVITSVGFYSFHKRNVILNEQRIKREQEEAEKRRIEEEKKEKYTSCLSKPYSEEELTDNLVSMKKDIDNTIINNHYQASVFYENLTTGFTYGYKETNIYYGCSLIKIVDALYLINQAILGNVDLDTETVTYTDNYKKAFSSGMERHAFGDKVTLRELIRHAIAVSDNSAHLMLVDYIGFDTLKEYGKSLGANVILTGGDKYGNQTAHDTNIYLKEAYKIINENEEYGPFLKEIMGNDERNSFNTEDIKIYHKYGSYDVYYHDIGLSLEENPYAISILTLHEKSNYKEVIQNIHEKVRELNSLFYENRKTTCYQEIYGT